MASKDNDKKAMDVAKPGKLSPDTSGRPVLITHRPIVQDPMVNKATEGVAEEAVPKKEVVSHSTKTLQPVDASLKRDDAEETETKKDETSAEEAAVVDAVAEQAEIKKSKDDKPNASDDAKQEHIQKLIDDKTYFVPVGQVARRRQNRNASIILIILLLGVLVGGYLAVDAGIIKTNIKLPVDLIKN